MFQSAKKEEQKGEKKKGKRITRYYSISFGRVLVNLKVLLDVGKAGSETNLGADYSC